MQLLKNQIKQNKQKIKYIIECLEKETVKARLSLNKLKEKENSQNNLTKKIERKKTTITIS